ncbi:trp operon leader peptide [Streptomyces sp. NPDC005805]
MLAPQIQNWWWPARRRPTS